LRLTESGLALRNKGVSGRKRIGSRSSVTKNKRPSRNKVGNRGYSCVARRFFALPSVSKLPAAIAQMRSRCCGKAQQRCSKPRVAAIKNTPLDLRGVFFMYRGYKKDIFLFCIKVSNSNAKSRHSRGYHQFRRNCISPTACRCISSLRKRIQPTADDMHLR